MATERLVVKPGDKVRSYFIMGDKTSYKEGIVVTATEGSFKALTTKSVFLGQEEDDAPDFFVAYQMYWGNTNDAWWGYRIELIEEAK